MQPTIAHGVRLFTFGRCIPGNDTHGFKLQPGRPHHLRAVLAAPNGVRERNSLPVPVGPSPSPSAGLGLSICQKLVSAMGGTLAVESSPGKGTCFSFRLNLPLALASKAGCGLRCYFLRPSLFVLGNFSE